MLNFISFFSAVSLVLAACFSPLNPAHLTSSDVSPSAAYASETFSSAFYSHLESKGPLKYTDFPTASLPRLLKASLEPVGSTLYVWGGGWNEEDTGANELTTSIGVSPAWEKFFDQQAVGYYFGDHLYDIYNGLDCSGFIGWTLYNAMNTQNGQEGLVMLASDYSYVLAQKGWGDYYASYEIADYRPGDILSHPSHVYMVLDTYDDGSVLLVHSAPPGVKISGTPAADGTTYSMALQAAEYIMSTYYPEWYALYPDCSVPYLYLTDYSLFRWNSETLAGIEQVYALNSEQLLSFLFSNAA